MIIYLAGSSGLNVREALLVNSHRLISYFNINERNLYYRLKLQGKLKYDPERQESAAASEISSEDI